MCTMPRSSERCRSRRASLGGQVVDLFSIELTNWRWSWRSMVITATLAPVFSTLALGIFARDSGSEALAYVLTGNVILSLMFGNMNSVQSHFSFMRFQGVLDYFATLPIYRPILILAVVLSFLLLSLPSLVVTFLLGSTVLGVPIVLHPLLVLVVPLSAVSLSGIGALIGTCARTPQEGDALSLTLTLGMAGLGPVVVPPDRLPRTLRVLGRLSPATYAASALRQVLLGPVTIQILIDLAVLTAMAVLLFGVVIKTMDWRQH
jgi:ABC-2 type transport system permease protein